ncbi:MAG: lysophospholipase [Streptococcaceae bacterium]|nr:lysophospholipase [Streptococcaceae bacterium]
MHEFILESVNMKDGVKLRVGRTIPKGEIKGVIQIVHGFGEHLGNYQEFMEIFAKNGYACIMLEQRGFGQMPDKTVEQRKKAQGVIIDYTDFMRDIKWIRKKIDLWYPGKPVILFGHSMGGNIAINALLRYSGKRYTKAIIESPWLELPKPLPKAVLTIAQKLAAWNKQLAVSSRLNKKKITRDTSEVLNLQQDKIFHDRISFHLLTQVLEHGKFVQNKAGEIELPVLLLSAGQEKIVSLLHIEDFVKQAKGNFQHVHFPDGYHLLHADLDKKEVYTQMLHFVQ